MIANSEIDTVERHTGTIVDEVDDEVSMIDANSMEGIMDEKAKGKGNGSTNGSGDGIKGTLENVVSLKGVSKHYGGEGNLIRALDNVDLRIRRGSVVSIMGPSGSGKSTLINMVGSLDVPTQGEVIIDNANLENLSQKELTKYRSEKVGFIFQSFNLLPNLTALENVELPMEFSDKYRKGRRERAESLLRSIGMSKRGDHFPASLSGGEKQRIAIARALANNPSIILADEPTGNLDSKTGSQIIELLKKLAKNRSKTLIIVTHDQNIANMTDEIININDGKITRVRDVSEELRIQNISSTFDIRRHFANLLFEAGYETIGEILKLDVAKLNKIKGLKKKDRSHILNRITKSKKKLIRKDGRKPDATGMVCPSCKKEIFMEGAVFCPFCAGKIS